MMHFSVVASLLLAISSVSATYQPSAQVLAQNDIAVLQYALILEDLEYTFYTKYQAQYSAQDFVAANIGLTATDYSYFNLIQQHELAHVQLLNSTVPSPTTSCTYNFPVNSVSDYISVAKLLENTGVSAYDGALNNFYNPELAQIAATIATIEARHASYLNNINGVSPFPSAFDTALNSTTIADIVFGGSSPLAVCNFVAGFKLPQLYIVYPVQNASDSTQPTDAQLVSNDVTVLQYALFLEHLEAAFYKYVLNTFTAAQLGGNTVYNYITMIGQHENTHVSTLETVISAFTDPIANCTYNFTGIIGNNATLALQTAAGLEAAGVGAYDGAAKAIYSSFYKQVAATIVTVEARHASYINYVIGNAQGPVQGAAGAFDIALTFNQTFGIVVSTNLISSCPAFPSPYSVLIVKPYTNATFNPSSTGTTGTVAPTPSPAATTGAATTGTTGASTTGNVAPTPSPASTGTTTAAASSGTTTAAAAAAATGASTRGSTTARTSGASIASASVVVALLVAFAAL